MTAKKYTIGPDIDLDTEEVHLRDGTRLTEQRAQVLAEQTLSEVRRGRPPLAEDTEAGERSPRVSFRIPAQTRRRAEERAHAEGRTLSDLAREALERYLA